MTTRWLQSARSHGAVRKITTCCHFPPRAHRGTIHESVRRISLVKGKGSPYSTAKRRVPELIPVLGSQPAGDVSHKPGGRLPLLSARPEVTPATEVVYLFVWHCVTKNSDAAYCADVLLTTNRPMKPKRSVQLHLRFCPLSWFAC